MKERAPEDRGTRNSQEDLEKLMERGRVLHSRAVFEALAKLMAPWKLSSGNQQASAPIIEEASLAEDSEELLDRPLHS